MRSAWAKDVRALIERSGPIPPHASVLEVGSGAHGLIFFLDGEFANAVGADPLAHEYARLFPQWQRSAITVSATGECLPFRDGSFDLVLCDNVVDHAAGPRRILDECVRVLRPGGRLYFSVHVHHRIYALASAMHAGWTALHIPLEIGPFADHTYHFTPAAACRLFAGLPLQVEYGHAGIKQARAEARSASPRHLGDRLQRIFFKNALYEIVARRL